MVPAITEDIAEEDADRGFDQRLYWAGQDRLDTGSRRTLSSLQVSDSIADLIPKIPGYDEVLDVTVLRVELSADGNDLSIGLY